MGVSPTLQIWRGAPLDQVRPAAPVPGWGGRVAFGGYLGFASRRRLQAAKALGSPGRLRPRPGAARCRQVEGPPGEPARAGAAGPTCTGRRGQRRAAGGGRRGGLGAGGGRAASPGRGRGGRASGGAGGGPARGRRCPPARPPAGTRSRGGAGMGAARALPAPTPV